MCEGLWRPVRGSLRAAIQYADARVPFDKPLSAFQLTRKKLADTSLSLGGAALLALHLGRLKDQGRIRPEQLSVGLESVPTHEGTGEIHTLVIGQTLSGRSAYR
ncbi:acyl-CoA dehydrogenase family protein [Streptomyces fulvoviolaceus]|uniref:acyl-CoA dehydrogenase family protein n=1 Tax=Streptomyces fulvoviolaceus TaxID=285535 RepID=UPI00099613AA|nr:acyl-CoA dehydrogenase family protein [Streptomyces fulvoviolaceus]